MNLQMVNNITDLIASTTKQILNGIDFSFKYILIAFNLLTMLVLYLHNRGKKIIHKSHILLVTAHPDDEIMFFRPTIVNYSQIFQIHLLCLSGANSCRKQQLQNATKNLPLYRVTCEHNELLIDGLKTSWCQTTIRKLIIQYVVEHNIKAIYTFDAKGVSSHPNHITIHNALKNIQTFQLTDIEKASKDAEKQNKDCKKYIKNEAGQIVDQLEVNKTQIGSIIKIYYLQSTGIIRKYFFPLEFILFSPGDRVIRDINFRQQWVVMSQHRSQFIWFRKLWCIFSRYAYINTYSMHRIKIQ